MHTENKTTLWILITLLALLSAWVVAQVFGDESLVKGEKVNCWTVMTEQNGGTFTIQTATMEVLGEGGDVWQAQTGASINGGQVWSLIDTTFATFTAGKRGFAKFRYLIDPELYIYKVPIKIYE